MAAPTVAGIPTSALMAVGVGIATLAIYEFWVKPTLANRVGTTT